MFIVLKKKITAVGSIISIFGSTCVTSPGTISSPTVNSPSWIWSFSFSFKASFVSGVGMEISPPRPFNFYLLGCRSTSAARLNLCRLTHWEISHSWAIWPPFFAISPFRFVILYLLAISDKLAFTPSAYPSTSDFRPFLSHVKGSKLPAWRFLLTVESSSCSELISFTLIAASQVSKEVSSRSRCLAAYDCRSPTLQKKWCSPVRKTSCEYLKTQHYSPIFWHFPKRKSNVLPLFSSRQIGVFVPLSSNFPPQWTLWKRLFS